MTTYETTPSTPKTCPLAIWSLALSVLGCICLFWFGSIPGIICGHMAMSRIKGSAGALGGVGMAIAGLVIGYIGAILGFIALLGVLTGLFLPAIATSRGKGDRVQCMSNLKQIALVCMVYANDNDQAMPPDFASLSEYVGHDASPLFVSPRSGTQPGPMEQVDAWSDYALVPNRKTSDPGDNVLAFSKPHCHNGIGGHVATVNGSVRWVDKDEYDRVVVRFLTDNPN